MHTTKKENPEILKGVLLWKMRKILTDEEHEE
jgi:hypothetical protein